MLAKKQLQILIVALLFSGIIAFVALPNILNLAVINQDHVVGQTGGFEVTTGDVLTVFALFGTTVTVAVWLLSYQRGRSES